MSRIWTFLAMAALALATSMAEAQIIWKNRLHYQTNNDQAYFMEVDAAGNSFVVGLTYTSGAHDFLAAKYSPEGQRLWMKNFGRPDVVEVPDAAALDSAGNLLILGRESTQLEYNRSFVLLKVAPAGNLLWRRTYSITSGATHNPRSIAVDAGDNILLTGQTGVGEDSNMATLKFSPAGVRLWVRHFGGPYLQENPKFVKTDSAGNVLVVGSTRGLKDNDVVTLKYDPNGTLLWHLRYDGPYGGEDLVPSIGIDSLDNVVVVSSTETRTTPGLGIIKYSPSGVVLWDKLFHSNGDYAPFLAIDSEDNMIVAATASNATANDNDYHVLKLKPTGSLWWKRTYAGPNGRPDRPKAVAVDVSGNIFVTGESENGTSDYDSRDYLTCMYSPTGALRWAHRYNGDVNLNDYATAVRATPDGHVVVTGYSIFASTGYDFLTIKYRVPR